MKIAFISTIQSWGGSEELWALSALKLKREGHQVFVSVVSWNRSCAKVVDLANNGIQVETHSPRLGFARTTWQNFKYGGPKYYHRLKLFDPDLIVISQGHNAGGFGWAKVAREISKPYAMIMQCNGDQWWFGEEIGAAFDSYTGAERIFCAAQRNLDLLRLQVGDPLTNAEVIWNPYSISPDNVAAWPADSGVWRIVCPARLYPPAKGQDLLLQAMALPQWQDRPVELNLYGSGPDEAALRRLASMLQLKNVQFRGFVSDLLAIWTENHLLVLPSRFEGLPIVLMDGMWCARPAVVTDVGDNARMCIDGQTGFVAESPTLGSISQALERAWQRRGEWRQMGLAARKRAEDLIPRDPVSMFCDRLKTCIMEPQHC